MNAPCRGSDEGSVERRRLDLRGAVQGVGFGPFVYRIASAEGLSGFARNTSDERNARGGERAARGRRAIYHAPRFRIASQCCNLITRRTDLAHARMG